MKHSSNSLDGTRKISFLNKIEFWISFPFIWILVFFRNIGKTADERKFFNVTWESIEEMPIYNWVQICETGDINFVFKTIGIKTQKTYDKWLDLQQEYIDEFGLDKRYKQRIRLTRKLVMLNLQYVATRRTHLLNIIRMTEIDLEKYDTEESIEFYAILDHVEKYKGFQMDPKTISVKKWYHSLKNMSKHDGSN